MLATKVIKRYANRKLYDTGRSCYVTLDDIAAMIKAGDDVRVVDNKTGEDLTSVTFAQIIFEIEKQRSFMPLTLLRDLIQNGGGALGEFARERVDRVQTKAHELKETAEKLRHGLEDRIAGKKLVSDLLRTSQRAFDELQKNVEERIKGSVGTMSRYTHLGQEMDDIRSKLAELERRLEKMPQ